MSAVLHRNLKRVPPTVVRGEGCYLIDAGGRRYLDASGGAAVSCLGHSHPAVIEAVRAQVGTLAFAHTSFFTNEPTEALAQHLIDRAPPGFGAGRVAFVGSGSEAMEAALKLARQHFVEKGEPKRVRFISRRLSYHGNTLGALAVGGHVERRATYQPMLMDTAQIAPCFEYRFRRADETAEAYGRRVADELATTIETLGAETVAAFVAEPVVGASMGSTPPVPGYMKRIAEICRRYGVLFIADEVMCGMGRCGDLFVSAREGVAPDIITIAKGLGAGYQPIGAVMASEATVAPILGGSGLLAHGHTYMSHLVACAGALAVLRTIEAEDLLRQVRERGAALEARLRAAFRDDPNVGDVRGRGLFWSVELVRDRATKAPFEARHALAAKMKAHAQAIGLICYPSSGTADGVNGDHLLVAPPFIASESELGELVTLLKRTVDEVLAAERLRA
ncbi:MAG: aspartate aminotransferase family protein [Alphaproteobacteria bacterium]|nr:aspartate aminotransferase family protein [Alphaproteobacteria bacterium]